MAISIGRIDPPQKTYFYKRADDTIFACHAREAFKIHDQYEQVGVSDGKKFYEIMQEAVKTQDTSLLKTAYDEELKVARGHNEIPPNDSIEVIGGSISEFKELFNG